MFVIPSPEDRRFIQLNQGDLLGNIHTTRNINFDNEGYLCLAEPSTAVMTENDDSDFGFSDAMNIGDGTLFMNASEVFEGDVGKSPLSNRSTDTNAPSPGVEDDVIYFNNTQVVSDGTTVSYLSAATTWTDISLGSMTSAIPTCLALFDAQNSLMIGNSNTVQLVNTSWTVTTTLTLPEEYQVSSMVSNGSFAYIGTRHIASGEARMFIWDGTGSAASESYGVEAYEIPTIKAYGSSVACLSSDGRLLRFNGGGFDVLAVLPIYITNFDWSDDNNDNSVIANRGMIVDGNRIFLNFQSRPESSWKRYLPDFPGGVWCYDPRVGLYHRYGHSLTTLSSETIATSAVDTSSNEITVSAAPKTGTPVLYEEVSGSFLTPLRLAKVYYVIYVDATTIQLAASYTDAAAGTAISLTGTGNNNQKLWFYNVNDYGSVYNYFRLAIAPLTPRMKDDLFAGNYVFSGRCDSVTNLTHDTAVLNTPQSLLPNRGYFTTPKLYSANTEDIYNSIRLKHLPLGADDKIIVKYRTNTKIGLPTNFDNVNDEALSDLGGTWTDTDTFTTKADLSAVEVGHEVEIVHGVGSGVLGHVTAISEASGTYTVSIDQAFPFADSGDKMLFIVDNWKKLGEITAANKRNGFRLDKKSDFVQFKIELQGIGVTIVEVVVENQKFNSAVNPTTKSSM